MPSLNFDFGKISFAPSYFQAGAIVFLLFLLVLTLAQVRRHFVGWGIKGGLIGLFFGFLLALIFEGFLIIGGKTAVTEVLGWKNPPQLLQVAINAGREKLVQVLGITNEIPASVAQEKPTAEKVIEFFQGLSPTEVNKVRKIICQP
jgi:hypothetical protein